MKKLIAILRGITPGEVVDVAEVLVEEGIAAVEVPLNSPDPFTSVERLATAVGDVVQVGAGTVLTTDDVTRARDAGARLIVSPHTDPAVIARTLDHGLTAYPGVATPTEAFTAIGAGARHLKLFPADAVGTAGLRAWRAVLPPDVALVPVGGVDAANLAGWLDAGAAGAGLGSCLYRPGDTPGDVREHARELARALATATRSSTRKGPS